MFVKYPEAGKVKSRLNLGGDEGLVADLYRCFIEDLLERLSAGDYRFLIAYDPPERQIDFMELFGAGFSYMPQIGADLGIRMYDAIRCFLEGFRSVVVIGSDSPDLPRWVIAEAFKSLDSHGAVIGPAWDGGYYLIGFSRDSLTPHVFEDMAWGTESVFNETMRRFRKEGISVHVLPKWIDMDRPEDIHALMMADEGSDFAESRTIRYLKERGFKVTSR
jgi:rSAM/selenodomain-associated transferase 1